MHFQCVMFNNMTLIHSMAAIITAVFHPNYQNLQKVEYDIVLFNGNVLGHAWHT